MKWFFDIISGKNGVNKLSAAYSRYITKKHEEENKSYLNGLVDDPYNDKPYMSYLCPGAGRILISSDCNFSCGGGVGFDFGVSWGRFGYVGGVLHRRQAQDLAEHILEHLSEEE